MNRYCKYCGHERLEEGDVGTHYEGKKWCQCNKSGGAICGDSMKFPAKIQEEIAHYRATRIPRCPSCKTDLIKTKSTQVQGKEIASVWVNECKCNKRKLKLCIG